MQASFETQTIKWAFNSPRDELTTQLQQQLQTCVSPALVSEMFHADFQHHLKAIGMLLQVRRREISIRSQDQTNESAMRLKFSHRRLLILSFNLIVDWGGQ